MNLLQMAAVGANVYLRRRYPLNLILFVTNRCNARCPHCFIDFDDPKGQKSKLSIEEIEKLSYHLGPSLMNVNLTGGEPFLRGDLVEIGRILLQNTSAKSVFVTSNGAFPDRVVEFTRTLTERFKNKKVLFSFSIDDFPAQHNETRRVPGLYENVMVSYRAVREFGDRAAASIGITVSHTNYNVVMDLYRSLIEKEGVRQVSVNVVRDEGVFRTPPELKHAIHEAYSNLSRQVAEDMKTGALEGYHPDTFFGYLLNKKSELKYRQIRDIYQTNEFKSHCHAGSLLGIIGADGTVYPCEVLDRSLGNLRDYDYDFMKLWADSEAQATRAWIKDTRCTCTYECAWNLNILGNIKYQPKLFASAAAAVAKRRLPLFKP